MDTYLPPRDNEKLSPTTKRDVLWNAGGSTIRDDFARSASEAADVYRRRSPAPPDRRSRQRNRSRSPLAIDRYQPEPRFSRDDFYNGSRDRDERRRGPSPAPSNIDRYVPGQDSPVPQPTMNLQDPNKIDSQVGFSYFWEWWRLNEKTKEEKKNVGRRQVDRVKGDRESREDREREKVQIQLAYDVYKEGLQCRMSRSFVNSHKGEEWFKEKYVAEFRDPFRQKLNEYRHGLYMQFESDLESGCFDEFTLEGIPKSESNGAGGILEKEEGETTATAEVLGVGDLVTLRGGDIRDEGAYQPALLIKTIAPNVCRAKLEEYSKEHLGDGPGGFKWLSLSDPNPSKRFHRIGWIMLNPEGDTQQSNERGDGREEDANSVSSNTAAGTTLSSAEKALKAIDGKTVYDEVRGDFTCHVGVHVPPSDPRKKALWDLFSSPDRIERDLQLVKKLVAKFEQEIGSDVNGLARIEQRVSDLNIQGLLQTVPQLPAGAKNSKKTDSDMEAHEIEEGENDPDDELEEGEDEEDIDDDEMLVKKKTLDLCVEYLRRVFNFCFFCVLEGDSVHELARKCPGGHLRRPRACLSMAAKAAATASACGESFPGKLKNQASDEGIEASPIADSKFSRTGSKSEQQLQRAFNWVKTFEDKILQILEPENVNIGKLGGKPIINALEEELRKFMKQEDPNKYRCKVLDCTKLFKAEVFWRKHVEKRHPDWFETVKQDLILVNAYVIDPAHIAPWRTDANSNGHFPPPNQNFTGTPRGFMLGNGIAASISSLPPVGIYPPGAFPPFMGAHTVQQSGSWSGSGAETNGGDRHQPGVIRRGGNRYSNQNRQGPYDRRVRDSREARWTGPQGRLTPPRSGMGGRMPGGGKWGDGAGHQAVGPREAVQGRSLKSYEDLDPVGEGGGGELNY